jgi:hypothetical protein
MKSIGLVLAALAAILTATAQATDYTWDAGGDKTNWFDSANWNPDGVPSGGDTAFVAPASGSSSVLLTNSTAYLSTFIVSNATLTFSNWTTALQATNIEVKTNGILTHAVCDTNAALWNTNRVYLVASNVTIRAGGKIDANMKGFRSRQGPGMGISASQGGSYGGSAGGRSGGTYGSSLFPNEPGSGGQAGAAGGCVVIEAPNGTVRVDGTIDADSAYAQEGPGSGGGILIESRVFDGKGVLRANGGTAKMGGNGSGGSGGRIAIHYDPTAQAVEAPAATSIVVMASGGLAVSYCGDPGTVYMPDFSLLRRPDFNLSGSLSFGVGSNWGADSLSLVGRQVTLPESFSLSVTQNLSISASGSAVGTAIGKLALSGATNTLALAGQIALNKGTLMTTNYVILSCAGATVVTSGVLDVRGGSLLSIDSNIVLNGGTLNYEFARTNPRSLSIGGSLVMTNGAVLRLYSGVTNAAIGLPHGGLLDLSGRDLTINSNCTIYSYSDNTNGGSIELRVRNAYILSNGWISAYGGGYRNQKGPGYVAGASTAAGYGGQGGKNGGGPYGSATCPVDPGSGGGAGYGGGLVWLMAVNGTVRVDGTLDAGAPSAQEGAGSGGGILVVCKHFEGTGALNAKGGSATMTVKADGGGGRIAVLRVNDYYYTRVRGGVTNGVAYVETAPETFTGSLSVAPGSGNTNQPGMPGTIRFGTQIVPPGTLFSIR